MRNASFYTIASFAKGKSNLTQHSESAKHIRASTSSTAGSQRSVRDLIMEQEDVGLEEQNIKSQARLLEIQLVACLARHQITLDFVDCLVPILKKYLPESEVVQELKLGREKARYLAVDGIAPIFEQETINKLKQCDAFVVGFDETAINKEEEMEILVKLAHPETGVELRHYKTVGLEGGDADTIVATLLG